MRGTRVSWRTENNREGWFVDATWDPQGMESTPLEGPFKSYAQAQEVALRLQHQYAHIYWLGKPLTQQSREELLQAVVHCLNTIDLLTQEKQRFLAEQTPDVAAEDGHSPEPPSG